LCMSRLTPSTLLFASRVSLICPPFFDRDPVLEHGQILAAEPEVHRVMSEHLEWRTR
jgi:hypothetical protein